MLSLGMQSRSYSLLSKTDYRFKRYSFFSNRLERGGGRSHRVRILAFIAKFFDDG
ncbi:hypothetical protein CpB0472 [Chlamydia pneumoniae TW-183]|uniref:Uncharacterized protein n=2 Tax=Chlamydia pneumoniae TaxID=83558 RepID=A0A0F7X1W4_CHLPN|nr:hypothetical protein CpB0472 [Chlamydia pneumoniae TW-183]ETR80357.1 hypothetical protein X556_0324 [Chlamydia pneumoniae B21]CRI42572.1 Uncharacterized protein BN1224_DC9_BS_00550 [Chlamydia pneumoniae]